MSKHDFHSAPKFKFDFCIGCFYCTDVCPAGAIQVENGHALFNPDHCIDCGQCYIVCPVKAIYIGSDGFPIYDYKCPEFLLSSVFSAQFEDRIQEPTFLSAIYPLGFKHIYGVEKSMDFFFVQPILERFDKMSTNEALRIAIYGKRRRETVPAITKNPNL